MSRTLPSLDLLRGFEAAARHLSFTAAAQELFVTQSAVSRQVMALEDQLGVALFQRRHRAILLTEAGQLLFRSAGLALRQIEDTVVKIREGGAARSVTVSCTLGFASLWLVPRLADFRAEQSAIDLRISANNEILDIEREQIELAIRYCARDKAPEGAILLFGEAGLPVCSPALRELREHPLHKPADLAHHVLLHLELEQLHRPAIAWPLWLEMAGLEALRPAGSLRFSHYDQLITAAVEGQGVALGSTPLVSRLLAEGRLIAPFSQTLPSPRAYYVVIAKNSAHREEVRQFVDWLLRKSGADSTPGNSHPA
jgi:LysR family transcriptional regulator, glycine cleavage system transcriptional activator